MLISKFDNTDIEIEIEDFEQKYNFNFPEIYRKFLLKYNGGETPKSKFKINKISSDIRAFCGLGNANPFYHFNSFEKSIRFAEWLKDQILPVATNVFGDYIMIGVNENNYGKIYFYYHDRPKKYIELTDDFQIFINKCKSEKIGHVKSIEERIELVTANGFADEIEDLKPGWQAEIDKYANMHQEKLVLDLVE